MNLFENVLLNAILIIFPLLVYVIYEAYNKVYDFKKSGLCLDFAIITSFYFVVTFKNDNYSFPYLLMNIPLFLAYLKRRNTSIIILSIFSCCILSRFYNTLTIYIVIEYIIYFIIYLLSKKKDLGLLNIFVFFKIIFYLIHESITKPYVINNFKYLMNAIIIIIPFILVTYIIYYTFKKANGIINFQTELRKLQEEKNLRMSLFKITHEIKNPITVCKGYLEMFDINDKEKSKKYISIMKREIKRVLILLEDFLSINKIKIEKDIIDINLLLEEVTSNFIPLLKEENIDRIFNISKDELFINADYNRLNQVFINIIKNSIESIGKNGLIIVSLKCEKDEIEIKIEDTGIGMDKAELKKISEPFFSTKENGTGLGVYLSKQIIEAHGGTIKYISKKYIGTKAIITLPYEKIEF